LFTGLAFSSENRNLYALFSLRWATMCWANGNEAQKQKAINILSDYYKGKVNFTVKEDIEISSTLLMYSSINLVNDWRELKSKIDFNEVSYSEFREKRDEQVKECQGLLTHIGNPLYTNVSRKKLTEFASSTKQSLITAFFNYIDVLIRIKKKDLAIEICDYVISTGPMNFRTQFSSKRSWLSSLT